MEYLSLGKIIDSFGLDGTVKIFSSTTNGKLRYKKGNKVFIDGMEYTVMSYRHNGNFDFVRFEEINNPEMVKTMKGLFAEVPKDRNELKEGYYFFDDLKGCSIIDEHRNTYGVVKEVEEFPAQITLRVSRKGGKDFFVPFVKAFIIDVNIDKKEITINVVEGLL